MSLVPQEWSLAAKCVGMNDVFFVDEADQKIISRFCNDCPVRKQCLDEALAHRIEWGVWGGTTERQRRKMLRAADADRRDLIAS